MSQVEGLLGEGFFVEWAEQGDTVFLKVWEYGFDRPDWEHVFREEDLASNTEREGK